MFYEYLEADYLTHDQRKLLAEIAEQFKPEETATDMAILYEVTGF